MNQLDLLWKMEEEKNLLEEDKKKIDLEVEEKKIEYVNNKIKVLVKKIEKFEAIISSYNRKIRQSELKLKDFRYEMEEIERKLYSGDIKDINQLELISKEKDYLLNEIDNLELEVLSMMEDEESVNFNILELKSDLDRERDELLRISKDYEGNINLINERLVERENLIGDLTKEIEDNILDSYYNIKKRKNRAMVELKDGICSGCNMRIPTYLLSPLRSKKELVYCNNCGRILYYRAGGEDK